MTDACNGTLSPHSPPLSPPIQIRVHPYPPNPFKSPSNVFEIILFVLYPSERPLLFPPQIGRFVCIERIHHHDRVWDRRPVGRHD